ncbi:hypothetical protein COO60DRAFT_616909 [Scenedesmus sp. NREL 46B-D3]|nr:hypothetical protein COO60DRAFT_616909 [Scenedesmus sp. NREL 46B-D3]
MKGYCTVKLQSSMDAHQPQPRPQGRCCQGHRLEQQKPCSSCRAACVAAATTQCLRYACCANTLQRTQHCTAVTAEHKAQLLNTKLLTTHAHILPHTKFVAKQMPTESPPKLPKQQPLRASHTSVAAAAAQQGRDRRRTDSRLLPDCCPGALHHLTRHLRAPIHSQVAQALQPRQQHQPLLSQPTAPFQPQPRQLRELGHIGQARHADQVAASEVQVAQLLQLQH